MCMPVLVYKPNKLWSTEMLHQLVSAYSVGASVFAIPCYASEAYAIMWCLSVRHICTLCQNE